MRPNPWAKLVCWYGAPGIWQERRRRYRLANGPYARSQTGTGTWAGCIWTASLRLLLAAIFLASYAPIRRAIFCPVRADRVCAAEQLSKTRSAMLTSCCIERICRRGRGSRFSEQAVDGPLTVRKSATWWACSHSCKRSRALPVLNDRTWKVCSVVLFAKCSTKRSMSSVEVFSESQRNGTLALMTGIQDQCGSCGRRLFCLINVLH